MMELELSSIRRPPGPEKTYSRFAPVTLQFDTMTWQSLRANAPVCKLAAYVQRNLRTALVGTVLPLRSVIEPKSSEILHLLGDVPPLIVCHVGCQLSVLAPATLA